ncbi:MAG: LysR family transcriptional regulator [Hungatella sp.]|nr:LysR family transcriptional regulator [Hungatella sp.]
MEQNLSQYKIFYEVAKTGNISRAAKELYISQPAISKAIGKLEDSLSTPLFIRSSRGVHLTDEGRILFEHTRRAFEELQNGEAQLKRARQFHMGRIRIGVSNTLCRYIMVSYLKGFIEQFPHVKITIDGQSTTHTMAMLEQQKIDLGLVAQPRPQKNLVFIPVMEIQDIFVASPAYLDNLRLREGQDADVFQAGNIMLLDRSNVTRRYIDEYMSFNRIAVNSLLEVTTMDLLIEFARIGLGIGSVIREFVQEDLTQGRLVQVEAGPPFPKRCVGFAYFSNHQSGTLTTFLDFCRSLPAV